MAGLAVVGLAGCGGSHKASQPPPTHLVAIAAATQGTPAFGTNPSTEYIISARGHVLETAKGSVPRRLAGLTNILSGLIDRYS